VHVAWVHGTHLYYRQRLAGGAWSASQLVVDNAGAEIPQMAVDNNRTVHLIWRTSEGTRYARRPSGGSWSAPEVVSNSTNPWQEAQIGVTGAGVVHVVWQGVPAGDYSQDVLHRSRAINGTWTAVQNISNSFGIHASQSKMALDENGAVHVVWAQANPSGSGNSDVFYARRPAGGSWSAPRNISQQPLSTSHYPQMAVTANGIVHVAWSQTDDSSFYYSRRASDGAWSAPYRFSDTFGHSLLRLFLDGDDNVHMILGYQDRHLQRSANGNWSPVVELRPHNLPNIEHLYTGVDSSGQVHVVYQDRDDLFKVYYSRQAGSNSWTTPRPLEDDPNINHVADLQMLVDTYTQAHLVWRNVYQGTYYSGPERATTATSSQLTQAITLPLSISSPTLSFLYQSDGLTGNTASHVGVEITSGGTTSPLATFTQDSRLWRQHSIDLTPWAGQTVSVTFHVEQAAAMPLVAFYLDEVTVGAARPDVWIAGSNNAALPGEEVVFTLTYGNRGGALAAGTLLTYTLPAELAFVTASLPPVSTAPLVWVLGSLAAGSGPFTLEVVARVSASAPALATVTSTAVISTSTLELEIVNNEARAVTFIGRFTYLPLLSR
jgi:uncharacterized repeat protein (TIGR01451 family)